MAELDVLDVLVLGGVGVDTIVRVPELVIPPGDLLLVPPVRDYVAHSGNGVALGFHGLGLRTKFADLLGEDALGALVLARYEQVGLDFSYLPRPEGTARSVNFVDAEGRRFSFFDGRYPPDAILPREFYLPFLERARHLHVAGRAFGAFADAHRLGVSTSTDIHAWDGSGDSAPGPALQADLVFLSAAAAPEKIDELMARILDQGRAGVVVATEGADGSRVLTRDDSQIRRFPAVRPERPVVDSNGAGDAFSTAFMSRWLLGRPIEECMLAGAVSGAFACGAHGTHEEQIDAQSLADGMARAANQA
ncbi:MAG TPA: carbohydrate kinase family protein [Actinocrinis sp.]|nr:carbohydrate kinase family protein [Actinocrinis sp.]